MNKIIFQIGLLAFFVASVIYGVQGYPLFETVIRAFIVFIGSELIGALVLTAVSWIAVEPKIKKEITDVAPAAAKK
jgi:hypothetical protein